MLCMSHSIVVKHSFEASTIIAGHVERKSPTILALCIQSYTITFLRCEVFLQQYECYPNPDTCNVLSVEMRPQSHNEERIRQAVEGISTQISGRVRKSVNARINDVVSVDGEHIEQDSLEMKVLEYLYYNAY